MVARALDAANDFSPKLVSHDVRHRHHHRRRHHRRSLSALPAAEAFYCFGHLVQSTAWFGERAAPGSTIS